MRLPLVALLSLVAIAACDTARVHPEREPDPFDGFVSGVANGVAFSDSVQVRHFPEFGRVDVDAPLPRVDGVSCSLSATFFLDLEPGVQDLRRSGEGPGVRGLLVVDGGGDAVCDFLVPTQDEANRIVLASGDRPGELTGTFSFVAVGDRESLGLDTLRVDDGRLTFAVEPGRPVR